MASTVQRTAIYVDGFNLYYGSLKLRPTCRWLNIKALCQRMLSPDNSIVSITYCTAKVKPRPDNLDQPKRQAFYLRALATLPEVDIVYGQFREHPRWSYVSPFRCEKNGEPQFDGNGRAVPYAVYDDKGVKQRHALVVKSDEKGSDVNLASRMLRDAFQGTYDIAVMISNDSDLAEPVRIITRELKKRVGVLCPYPRLCHELARQATFEKVITETDLSESQFPRVLTDGKGAFYCPSDWS